MQISEREYIAFLNDDEWLPEKIEKQVSFFNENPEYKLVHYGVIREVHMRKSIKGCDVGLLAGGDSKTDVLLWIATTTRLIVRRCLFDENLRFW